MKSILDIMAQQMKCMETYDHIVLHITEKPEKPFKCPRCEKRFQHKSSRCRHTKNAHPEQEATETPTIIRLEKVKPSLTFELRELLDAQNDHHQRQNEILMEQKQEEMNQLKAFMKSQQEMMQTQLQTLLQNAHTTVNNNTTNNFNLNVFLTETCKDAMLWSEFMSIFTVEDDDIPRLQTIKKKELIADVFIRNIQSIEYSKRPVYCLDAHRATTPGNMVFREMQTAEDGKTKVPVWNKKTSASYYLKQICKTISAHSKAYEEKLYEAIDDDDADSTTNLSRAGTFLKNSQVSEKDYDMLLTQNGKVPKALSIQRYKELINQ